MLHSFTLAVMEQLNFPLASLFTCVIILCLCSTIVVYPAYCYTATRFEFNTLHAKKISGGELVCDEHRSLVFGISLLAPTPRRKAASSRRFRQQKRRLILTVRAVVPDEPKRRSSSEVSIWISLPCTRGTNSMFGC